MKSNINVYRVLNPFFLLYVVRLYAVRCVRIYKYIYILFLVDRSIKFERVYIFMYTYIYFYIKNTIPLLVLCEYSS